MTASRAVRLLQVTDPSFRYAEHRKVASFYNEEIFLLSGNGIHRGCGRAFMKEMAKFLGCCETETRVLSARCPIRAYFQLLWILKTDSIGR